MNFYGLGRRAMSVCALLLGGSGLVQPGSVSAQEPAAEGHVSSRNAVRLEYGGPTAESRDVFRGMDLWGQRSFRGEYEPRAQEPEAVGQPQEMPEGAALGESLGFSSCVGGNCGCVAHGHYPTIATKRLPNTLFELDSAKPVSVIRLRFDSAYDHEFPDRAEYFWAKIGGRGPKNNEFSVDYQDFNYYMETAFGDGAASAFTEVPIRVLEPTINDNTAGLSDIVVGLKTVFMETDDYQITMVMRTYIPSGLARRGLGTGHTALEPGVLGRWLLCERTWLHGEFKFWFPLGGDGDFAGEVLRYGLGLTHLCCEWNVDSVYRYKAITASLELVGWSVLDGMETAPDGTTGSPDPTTIINVQPGVRLLCGKHMDFGFSASFAATSDHWYDELARFEFRWFF